MGHMNEYIEVAWEQIDKAVSWDRWAEAMPQRTGSVCTDPLRHHVAADPGRSRGLAVPLCVAGLQRRNSASAALRVIASSAGPGGAGRGYLAEGGLLQVANLIFLKITPIFLKILRNGEMISHILPHFSGSVLR